MFLREYSHEQEDGYDSGGEYHLQRDQTEDFANEDPSDRRFLEIAYILIGIFFWQHLQPALLTHPRLIEL